VGQPEHRRDIMRRTAAWLDRALKEDGAAGRKEPGKGK
jgi:hypothetical protein